MKALKRLTVVEDGELRFASDPPVLQPVSELMSEGDRDQLIGLVHEAFQNYRRTLQPDRRQLLERYRFVDLARKVVGVGSVGTRCWVALLVGRDDGDPLFLQVKEAERSVLEPYLGRSLYQHQGRRVVEGQRTVQSGSDIFLGWERIAVPGRRGPRPLLPPALGLEDLGRHRRHEPARARASTPSCAASPWPGPTPAAATPWPSPPTSAAAPPSARPWSASPTPTPTSTSATTPRPSPGGRPTPRRPPDPGRERRPARGRAPQQTFGPTAREPSRREIS